MNTELQKLKQTLVVQAKAGNAEAAAKLVELHCSGYLAYQHSKETAEACMLRLDFGNATAMCELARCCLDGNITDAHLRQIACNKTFKAKLSELARNYANGFTKPNSHCEAVQLFKFTEDQNNLNALCDIGTAYRFGWAPREMHLKQLNTTSKRQMLDHLKRLND